ncbi:MAG: glycyl-radical enzyme activating protein [Actinomycetia bacterium]|nr:glycyl-radical enzyme activating protein [Actinomycetes bacterium]MCP4227540.1 glycyl-radical enzyme activating protein [Actinomycetes bacterium]MCP5033160.1 glycyl-radical enzyme activating protein [Actinomycetes bacterium]
MTVTAPVFDVQRFSLHDGPGIRSLVFLKGCTLHCPWCQNPESQDHAPVVAFYRDRCCEYFECETACQENAIIRGSYRIDQASCTACGHCVSACPSTALRLIGEALTPEQLMEKLRPDLPYFVSSGGGVTFTGGEPMLHPGFLDRVLDLCRTESIHTNIETAGTFSFDMCLPILRKLDLIYFDLKLMDPAQHVEHLGRGHERILANAVALVENGLPVEFRMPLIPGFTDTDANIDAVIALLEQLQQTGIHLLSYHDMGEVKIDIIQGSQPRLGLAPLLPQRLAEVEDSFRQQGITILNDW